MKWVMKPAGFRATPLAGDKNDIIVETLLCQSRPGLYVTANLYRPPQIEEGQKLGRVQPLLEATGLKAGEDFYDVTEKDIEGKWSVFFFYPADFTFVCPTELGDLADHYDEMQAMGDEVISVSTDTHFTHKSWHATSDTIGKIEYPMVGDPSGTLSNNFGVMREERCAMRIARCSFVKWAKTSGHPGHVRKPSSDVS